MTTETAILPATALVLTEGMDVKAYYSADAKISVDSVVTRIETEMRSEMGTEDVTTEEGRKAIRSRRYTVAKSKTALDTAGGDLTRDLKAGIAAQVATIKDTRDDAVSRLEALGAEIMVPVDEWESAEAKRVEVHQFTLEAMQPLVTLETPAHHIQTLIEGIEGIEIGPGLEEFEDIARETKELNLTRLRDALADAEKREAAAAELEG